MKTNTRELFLQIWRDAMREAGYKYGLPRWARMSIAGLVLICALLLIVAISLYPNKHYTDLQRWLLRQEAIQRIIGTDADPQKNCFDMAGDPISCRSDRAFYGQQKGS